MNRHHDYMICQIISMHQSGQDIESIANALRISEHEEKWDIHRIGCLIGYYVSNCQFLNRLTTHITPDTVCKSNGVISDGATELMCPLYRKPKEVSS